MRFETAVIHAGQEPDPTTGAIVTPIYQTSTYVQEAPGEHKGYDYSRTINPTRTVLERNLADLEKGKYGLAFSSGMAAENTVMNLLKTGDHVIACNDLYGGTYRLFKKLNINYGIEFDFVDATNPKNIANALRENTKLFWIETPTNPLLKLIDIQAVCEISKEKNSILTVDNTFATPYLQQPLLLGADIIVHSTTKYLGGHSDLIGGALITSKEEIYEQLAFYQNAIGAVPGPFDCWLVLRGIKTLAVRMDRHTKNAIAIANYLEDHPGVRRVYYPGLSSHPQYELAKKQMKGFGGMVSFEIDGDVDVAKRFVTLTRYFALAESLGGVESLIEHPASMTHTVIPKEERLKSGLTDNLIRISVGIENIEDLLEDLSQAFKRLK